MTRVLVLNAGSATLKATVLDTPAEAPLLDRTIDRDAGASPADHAAAIEAALGLAARQGVPPESIEVVGHRVVHGGDRFTEPVLVDDAVLASLSTLAALAPLHGPLAVATIQAARAALPDIPHVAAFDTAFHAGRPELDRRYPVPASWARDHGVQRFGFHGLSVSWSVARAAQLLGRPIGELGLVIAHLGGGCSVTAVQGGRSVATTMGMTPLEGLMMATRAGSVDPAIVFRLAERGIPLEEIEHGLLHESGLLAVGGTSDMRRLLAIAGGHAADPSTQRANDAIALFAARAASGIAGVATALDRVDAVVFTGGIGTHAAPVRRRICERLAVLSVAVEPTEADVPEGDAVVARPPGRGAAVLRVTAREDLVIAQAAAQLVPRPSA